MHAAKQAGFAALLGPEDARRVAPLERLADSHEARQEPAGAGLGDDSATREDEADLGAPDGEPDVHRERHGDADADGRTIDRGDHRLVTIEDAARDAAAAIADIAILLGLIGELRARAPGVSA